MTSLQSTNPPCWKFRPTNMDVNQTRLHHKPFSQQEAWPFQSPLTSYQSARYRLRHRPLKPAVDSQRHNFISRTKTTTTTGWSGRNFYCRPINVEKTRFCEACSIDIERKTMKLHACQARIQLLAKGEVVKIMENNILLPQAANVSDRMPQKRVPQPTKVKFMKK